MKLDLLKHVLGLMGFEVKSRSRKGKIYLTVTMAEYDKFLWGQVRETIEKSYPNVYVTSGGGTEKTFRLNNEFGPGAWKSGQNPLWEKGIR